MFHSVPTAGAFQGRIRFKLQTLELVWNQTEFQYFAPNVAFVTCVMCKSTLRQSYKTLTQLIIKHLLRVLSHFLVWFKFTLFKPSVGA